MRICFDSGVLLGLYDEKDPYHDRALLCFDSYITQRPLNAVILPWPVMYESLSTHMARTSRRMNAINAHLKALRVRGKLEFIEEGPYRDRALAACLPEGGHRRALSLVDCVIRELLSDKSLQITALATFDIPGFHDICKRLRKRIIPEN
jgi:predicted nucleic acid-binding protein